MKSFNIFILYSLFFLITENSFTQSVGIGTTTPNGTAQLDITSTSKGLLLPRMTTVQRNAIISPATGLTVYDTNTNGFWYYNGTTWTQLSSGSATNYWSLTGSNIFNNNSGYIGIGTNTPDYKLSIFNNIIESNNNSNLLRLSGRNPVLGFYDESNSPFGYLKAWTNGANSGFSNGMVIGSIPGYPIFLSTNYGPTMTVANNNYVGIGTTTPDYKLTILNTNVESNNNSVLLRLSGRNPVMSITDETGFGYGYLKAWTNGANSGFTNGLVVGSYPGSPIFFSTNYGPTMTIADNGSVGIGTTTPGGKFNIAADNEAMRITGSQSYLSFYNNGAYKAYLWNKGNDNVELGTSAGNTIGNLYFSIQGVPILTIKNTGSLEARGFDDGISVNDVSNGGAGGGVDTWNIFPWTGVGSLVLAKNGTNKVYIRDDGSYDQASDIRLKEDFIPYKPVLEDVQKLNVLTYYYKNSKKARRSFGLIAQNVITYFPEIVSETPGKNGEKLLAMDYSKTGVIAIKAIQEQQILIEQQQQKINDLEKRLDALEKLINKQ